MHRGIGVCAFAVVMAVARVGGAQNPFALPGSPTLGPPVPRSAIPVAIDAAGNAWFTPSSCQTAAGTPYMTSIPTADAGVIDVARNAGIIADYNVAAPTHIDFY